MNNNNSAQEVPQWLSHEQKLQAIALKYYQGLLWEPKKGDYYTSSRADLELYRIVDEDAENFYTVYCDPQRGDQRSTWSKDQFFEGFGVNRVYVPESVLYTPRLSQEQAESLLYGDNSDLLKPKSMPLPATEPFAALTPSPAKDEQVREEAERIISAFPHTETGYVSHANAISGIMAYALSKGQEEPKDEYENKLDYYIGLLCDCYNAGELNPQLQHKIWEALHCVPERKSNNMIQPIRLLKCPTCSAELSTIGELKEGQHHEINPRAETWLKERENWQSEVSTLRERISELEAENKQLREGQGEQGEEMISMLCERYLAHIGKMGGINRFSLKAILREAYIKGRTATEQQDALNQFAESQKEVPPEMQATLNKTMNRLRSDKPTRLDEQQSSPDKQRHE